MKILPILALIVLLPPMARAAQPRKPAKSMSCDELLQEKRMPSDKDPQFKLKRGKELDKALLDKHCAEKKSAKEKPVPTFDKPKGTKLTDAQLKTQRCANVDAQLAQVIGT